MEESGNPSALELNRSSNLENETPVKDVDACIRKLGTKRGVETIFRNAYRVHIEVSALADAKANFLISVNSIILILIVAHGQKYITHKGLLLPVGIVIATCICSMIFAVLVARPRFKQMKAGEVSIKSGKSNLLFFGSFTALRKDEFIEGFSDLITSPNQLYSSMMGDIYEMGVVLKRKYIRLQYAYGILLYGFPLGLIIFVIMECIIVLRSFEENMLTP